MYGNCYWNPDYPTFLTVLPNGGAVGTATVEIPQPLVFDYEYLQLRVRYGVAIGLGSGEPDDMTWEMPAAQTISENEQFYIPPFTINASNVGDDNC